MKQDQTMPIFLLFLLAVVVTACGPAGNDSQSNINKAVDTSSAENVTESGEEDTAVSSINQDAPPPPTASAVEIDTEVVETDAKGIQVGFTADGRPYRGNPDASIVLEEFSDFQCPFCSRFVEQTMPGIEEAHVANGDVLIIFYDFPLNNIHPQAAAAANAARCAGEHNAASYWAMHDLLFANLQMWSNRNPNEAFSQFGSDLGLDMDSFTTCLESQKYADAIEADLEYGRSRGVSSTPSFFINDQLLVGAQPLSTFIAAIETIEGGGELAAAAPESPPAPGIAPTPAAIPNETAAAALGDPNAPITIVEYTDYQCPYCSRHSAETLPSIIQELVDTGRVYYLLKDFPLTQIHPDAAAASVAARCAGEQEAYWEMHDALFAEQPEWSGQGDDINSFFTNMAIGLNLDGDAFASCLASGKYDDVVQNNLEEGISLGVTGTPTFFVDGFPLVGARPMEHFELAVSYAEAGTLADAYVQSAPAPTAVPAGPVDVPEGDAYVIGDPDAPVTIVEYTDFQCPFCGRHFAQTFPQIKENFIDTGVVRYVFKDFPLGMHPQAVVASEAARCAGDQDAYLPMHDLLFEKQGEWSGRNDAVDIFTSYAVDLGLDEATFSDCLQNHKYEDAVNADLIEGSQLGVNGTPAFFINGYFLSGAQPYDLFEEAIVSLATEE